MKDLLAWSRHHWALLLGGGMLAVLAALTLAAPALYPEDPLSMVGPPDVRPFDEGFLFGTDSLGRDVAAGILHGARTSLLLGLVSTACSVLLGTGVGAVAGYFAGRVDDVLMRLTEFFQTIPSFMLALVLVAVLSPSIWTIVLAIAVVSWPPVARLVRAEFLSLRSRDFVKAAVVGGHPTHVIILRHILPNALTPIIVTGSLMVASAILLESALSFLGLGDRNNITWGFMIGAGRSMIRQAWWLSAIPGLAIFYTVLALNLLGQGLADLLNPLLARTRRA
ncbi:ABC transporter permease [Limobrevibacterium gyesilva]|uniref:ABC transporter permease n=1 Tax=Limobrevibacterium gyesilva TaxID=2991712 RepID=A0AA41YPR7_9PROT|nr:ABC transporter permease [Limobrevibacterium gyesilva]MCW3473292.1 ABC transporter permease [Limobrevibacterium gyesilva]